MGFLANGIRKISGLSATEERSYHSESDDCQDDLNAILLIAAAIAADIVEVVEDGVSELFGKPKIK